MNAERLIAWIDSELETMRCRSDNGFHTEKMIYHGSIVQMETLRALVVSGHFD